jgi:hypothetical protein
MQVGRFVVHPSTAPRLGFTHVAVYEVNLQSLAALAARYPLLQVTVTELPASVGVDDDSTPLGSSYGMHGVVGASVGADVGVAVGERVGLAVGGWVGANVGLAVGGWVGANVGLAVGEKVGRGVGF